MVDKKAHLDKMDEDIRMTLAMSHDVGGPLGVPAMGMIYRRNVAARELGLPEKTLGDYRQTGSDESLTEEPVQRSVTEHQYLFDN